jgi:NAD(P)-dependent dehydrogenase (short-subunit alcohol dehydrogenase family)
MKGTGGKVYAQQCDVSDESSVRAVFKWIEVNLGGVDVLVNNAGIFR